MALEDTNKATIQLAPDKAQGVDTALDLISQTVRGQIKWKSGDRGFVFRQYEAPSDAGKWVLIVLSIGPRLSPVVSLNRIGSDGSFLYKLSGIAALSGLAAAVEKNIQEDQAVQ